MAFKTVQSLEAETVTALGGYNKKQKRENPTSAEGYLLGTRQVPSKFSKTGVANLHILQTPTGNVGVFGKSDMDKKLASVAPGTMVRITFTGTKPTQFGEMNLYRVEQDPDNTIEVDHVTEVGEPTDENSDDEGDETSYEAANELPSRPSQASAARVQELLKGKGLKK